MNKRFRIMSIVIMFSFAAISFAQSPVYAGAGDNITAIDKIVPNRQKDSIDAKSPNDVSIVLENVESAGDKTIFQVSLRCNRPNTWVSAPLVKTGSHACSSPYSIILRSPFKILVNLRHFPVPDIGCGAISKRVSRSERNPSGDWRTVVRPLPLPRVRF